MVLWNLLDGGSSRSGPLLGPFESMWGGTPGTNPRQAPVHPPSGHLLGPSVAVYPSRTVGWSGSL
jgi:hypothetical protein